MSSASDDVLALCAGLPERTFAAGEVVLAEGTKTGLLYILVEGEVEVLKGEVQINTSRSPGNLYGEISALLGTPHMATVRALGEARFHVADDPVSFFRSHPDVALHLSRTLAGRLNLVTSYLVDLQRQYGESDDHLGMVDEVLESLVHHQADD